MKIYLFLIPVNFLLTFDLPLLFIINQPVKIHIDIIEMLVFENICFIRGTQPPF